MNVIDKKIDILREDYAQTLSFIDKCDDHIFKIKNWAIVTSSAVIAFAISQDYDILPLSNLVLLIAFVYLELIYKYLQNIAIQHSADISKRIDKYLEDPDQEGLLHGYNYGFGGKLIYPSVNRVFGVLRLKYQRHILNFYSLLAIFSIGAVIIAALI